MTPMTTIEGELNATPIRS